MYVRRVVCKPLARVTQWASGEMPKASDGLVVALATFFSKYACPADCRLNFLFVLSFDLAIAVAAVP